MFAKLKKGGAQQSYHKVAPLMAGVYSLLGLGILAAMLHLPFGVRNSGI